MYDFTLLKSHQIDNVCQNIYMSIDKICQVLQKHYGIQGKVQRIGGYLDQNFLIVDCNHPAGTLVCKLSHHSVKKHLLTQQNIAYQELSAYILAKTCRIPQLISNVEGQPMTVVDLIEGQTQFFRLFSYIHGMPMWDLT